LDGLEPLHLAQLNIADAKHTVDSDELVEFTGRIERIFFDLPFNESGGPITPEFPRKDCA